VAQIIIIIIIIGVITPYTLQVDIDVSEGLVYTVSELDMHGY
jgi:hypothetical protein